MHTYQTILGVVARGWCSEENKNKVMDIDLSVSIAKEVYKEILGLSQSQGRECRCQQARPGMAINTDGKGHCADCGRDFYKPVEEPKVDKWCEHMQPVNVIHVPGDFVSSGTGEWSFCPICGTPRPKDLTLVEKLAKKFKGVYIRTDIDNCFSVKMEELAAIALSFAREHKDKL